MWDWQQWITHSRGRCHVWSHSYNPGRATCWGPEAFSHQPWKCAILEAVWALVETSDDYSPVWVLVAISWETLSQNYTAKWHISIFLILRNCEIINVYCCKLPTTGTWLQLCGIPVSNCTVWDCFLALWQSAHGKLGHPEWRRALELESTRCGMPAWVLLASPWPQFSSSVKNTWELLQWWGAQ
jgi:hypothetical protein